MESNKKKELLEIYKNRNRDMGIICFRCLVTNESFLEITQDARATFNSIKVKLNMNFHPNKRLLELWQTYKEEGFDICLLHRFKYEDPTKNYKKELEKIRDHYLLNDPKAGKVWK